MANRGSNRQEEDDVDSFFLPGGILDFLNHDSADSLLSSMGLDSRTSHESRVLSMTAADHEPAQDHQLLDLPDPQALSSTGTNPNAKEFMPYPVNYDEYMPQNVGLHAPLPTYPSESTLHWATITPPPHEPHHVQSHSFVFDGPELIATEGLGSIVGFQQQPMQPALTPERPMSTTPPFEQPMSTRSVELLPTQRAVSGARLEFDMSTKSSEPRPRPVTNRLPHHVVATDRDEANNLQPSHTAGAAPAVAAPVPSKYTRPQPAAVSAAGAKPAYREAKEKERDPRTKPDRTRRQIKEPQHKDPSSSTSFLAVSSNQVRGGQVPAKPATVQPPAAQTLNKPAAVRILTPPTSTTGQPQPQKRSPRSERDAAVASDHRPTSLKLAGKTSPEPPSKPSKELRPRAATEEAPQTRHQQVQGTQASIAQTIPRAEAASPQGPDSMPESAWEPIAKLAASPIADRTDQDVENGPVSDELGVNTTTGRNAVATSASTAQQTKTPPTRTTTSLSPARPSTDTGAVGAAVDTDVVVTPRSDGTKSPRQTQPQSQSQSHQAQHQQHADAINRHGGKSHRRGAKDHPHHKHKQRNKHQPQQPAPKPAQADTSEATPNASLIAARPTFRTAYQYVLPLQRVLLAVCDKVFNVQSKTTVVSLLATGLSEALTLFVCLLAFVLAGLLSALVFALQLHEYAVATVMADYHVAFCFAFPYSFSVVVNYVAQWAPHWAPVCLWYSFLVQLFCTSQENGTTSSYASVFRVLIPLLFIAEGVTSESYLMYLDGSELLLLSFLLSGLKLECVSTPLFLLTWAIQVLCVAIFGPRPVLQYCQLVFSLTALHLISADGPKNQLFAVRRGRSFDDNSPISAQEDASQSA